MNFKVGNFWNKPFGSWSTIWLNVKGNPVISCDKTAISQITTYFFKFFIIQFKKSYSAK
jgi:hypothetical protein